MSLLFQENNSSQNAIQAKQGLSWCYPQRLSECNKSLLGLFYQSPFDIFRLSFETSLFPNGCLLTKYFTLHKLNSIRVQKGQSRNKNLVIEALGEEMENL